MGKETLISRNAMMRRTKKMQGKTKEEGRKTVKQKKA